MIQIIGPKLSQWDVGRCVSVSGDATHVHFANRGDSEAVIMEITNGEAKIPDYLFRTGKDLFAYAVKDGVTLGSKTFAVRNREKPENYIYEDDQRNYIYKLIEAVEDAIAEAENIAEELKPQIESATEAANEAKEAAEQAELIAKGRATGYVFDTYEDMYLWLHGAFGGDDFDNETAMEHQRMLNTGDNLYIRDKGVPDYWWDGEKEQQLETQKVDLTEYVKNTDYATVGDKAGVVRFLNINTGTYGIQAASERYPGAVLIAKANNKDIDKRSSNYKPIVPSNLDYAVHSVLGKQPKFISSYTGDLEEDAHAAVGDSGDYIGQIRLQGNIKAAPRRVWMYIGLDNSDPEVGLPVWLDLMSGETWNAW